MIYQLNSQPSKRLSELISPSFYPVHNAIKSGRHTHYFLKGGRGSGKSSFVSIEIIQGLMRDPQAHAVAYRKVGATLHDSVYTQLIWAVDALGVTDYWTVLKSPLKLIYKPTGQTVLFRGMDDAGKSKSIKLPRGYCRYIWYEEADQYTGMEELRKSNQSLVRGQSTQRPVIFYTYNPPKSVQNWINAEVMTNNRLDTLVHHSSYLDMPEEWLGEVFIVEAGHLKTVNETAYAHEYLGEVTGTGGEVFGNVKLRTITDEEIAAFDKRLHGLDWGYASDPLAYVGMHYDKTRRRLYIFDEIYKVGLKNKAAIELLKPRIGQAVITCDSAEKKSIDELRDNGLHAVGARKGPDSVEYGIKWLQDLEEIVIDADRCPNTAREFCTYELEPDGNGGFKAKYPDKNNHAIDAARYGCEDHIRGSRFSFD